MLKRILAVIISTILLALSLSLIGHIPEEQREPDVYYMGISESFMFIGYFLLIFYTVIGLPASWIIDKWRKRYSPQSIIKRYLIGMVLYALVGIIAGAIYYTTVGYIQFYVDIFFETVAYWVVASILYYHILCALERIFSKYSSTNRERPRNM